MQNDFVKPGGSLPVAAAEGTLPAIQRLLALGRRSAVRVVFTQDTHDDGDSEWEIWPEHARRGSWGWRIVEELTPRDDELVIEKVRYDAFRGTHLDHFLRLWGSRPSWFAARSQTSAFTTPPRARPCAGTAS